MGKIDTPESKQEGIFPIVGIGASAGGLQALEQLFKGLPGDAGMGFVVLQHLDPDHKSILVDILSRYTSMPVLQVEDNMRVEPDHVYVTPPGSDLALLNGRLQLLPRQNLHASSMPIDFFFRSLAQTRQEKVVCIILSGTGSDGSQGLKAVKSEGGIVFAQRPESATHDSMPGSAISTGQVDLVLTPDAMGQQLADIGRGRYRLGPGEAEQPDDELMTCLQKIYVLIRSQTGHDFSQYKPGTISRRVERRMLVNQIDCLPHYVRFLQQSGMEVETLFRNLLIGVTEFFRDPDAFDALQARVLIPLLTDRDRNQGLRIWSPGCASGEEAYSLAMLIKESMEQTGWNGRVQIFATDIDRTAVPRARKGLYPAEATAAVGKKRRMFHFNQQRDGFLIKKELRDMVIFAEQSLIKDPPFSNLDLIVCRNLLIYLGPELHRMILPIFYHGLKKEGYLFLGTSENIGDFTDHFKSLDAKNRIFQRQGNLPRPLPTNLAARTHVMGYHGAHGLDRSASGQSDYKLLTEQRILNDFSPAAALINEQRHLLYSHGPICDYLTLQPGEMALDILTLVRPELRLALSSTITTFFTDGHSVRKETGPVLIDGREVQVLLSVSPLGNRKENLLLVVFTQTPVHDRRADRVTGTASSAADARIRDLEKELETAQQQIFTLMEEAETADEESRSIQEELQSANQEMQSVNEEMETSREELQSTTEELITVNQELEERVGELGRINDDMVNLLASTEIGTVFLDTSFKIKRFTPAARRVISLQEGDEGRPIRDLHCRLRYEGLHDDLQRVLGTLQPLDMDVPMDDDSGWYTVRILPYRTTANVIEGLVLAFIDTTRLHQAEEKATRSLSDLDQIFNTTAEGLMVIGLDHHLLRINDTLLTIIGHSREEAMQKRCENLFSCRLCHSDSCVLERIRQGAARVEDEFNLPGPDGTELRIALSAQPFFDPDGALIGVVGSFRDITALHEKEEQLTALFEQAPDAILWTDAETGMIVRANLAAEKLLGWTRDELQDMPYFLIHPPDRHEVHKKIFTDHARRGGIFRDELELYTRDGRTLQTEVVAAVCRAGNHNLVQGIFRDLTDKQKAWQQVTWERDKVARLLDMSPGFFVAINRDETIAMINRRGCEILGRPQERLIGANWFDTCIPERMRAEVRQVFAQLMLGKMNPVSSNRNPILTADGRERLISWQNSLLIDQQQQVIGTLSAGVDVADEEVVGQITTDNERLMTAFFEEGPDYCYMVSPEGIILNVNKATAEVLGISREELIGRPLETIYSAASQSKLEEKLARWKEDGFLKNEEMIIIDKDGRERNVLLSVGTIRDRQGKIVSSVSVQRDISEL